MSYIYATAKSKPFRTWHPEYTFYGPGFDNCGDLHDAAKARKWGLRWITSSDRSKVKNGDLVIYNWGAPGSYKHVGIVIDRQRRRTIEGNRDGYKATTQIRSGTNSTTVWKSQIAGFIRVTQ